MEGDAGNESDLVGELSDVLAFGAATVDEVGKGGVPVGEGFVYEVPGSGSAFAHVWVIYTPLWHVSTLFTQRATKLPKNPL